jgi:hypothetical protein
VTRPPVEENMKKLDITYVGVATADDARNGRVRTDDKCLDLTVL